MWSAGCKTATSKRTSNENAERVFTNGLQPELKKLTDPTLLILSIRVNLLYLFSFMLVV